MRSPADMKVIQIEITNACLHSCSNCTRFCGHHRKPYFIDWETFKRAVDSLHGYDGIIGLMGGEPLLHPEFERMTDYLCKHHGIDQPMLPPLKPVRDFITATIARQNANMLLNRCKGPGLWTSMPGKYYKHFELIQDSFLFQNLNDHCNPSFHQPLLVARRDLGVPDPEWFKLRDACWIQNCWSASISPKGAFFCEMASALDMLFDGPGGWVIEPDWWKRTPAEFTDQLHWCEMCGAALSTSRRNANEQIDDVSVTLLSRLENIQSPKLKKGEVAVYPAHMASPAGDQPREWAELKPDQYIADPSQRLGASNRNLLPRTVNGIILRGAHCNHIRLKPTLDSVLKQCDKAVLLSRDGLEGVCDDRLTVIDPGEHSLGVLLNKAMQGFTSKDWVIVITSGQVLSAGFREEVRKIFLNPGVYHLLDMPQDNTVHGMGIAFFHPNAQALRQAGFDRIARCTDMQQFQSLWHPDKQMSLPTALKDLPQPDEHEWIHVVEEHFLKDRLFKECFSRVLTQAAPGKGRILITQSAPYFLTRALTRMTDDLGYETNLLTHERFADYFQDVIPSERLWTFNRCDMIRFHDLEELRSSIKKRVSFAGAVLPYGITHNMVAPGDGYQDIERVALDLAGGIICRVNMKRQFVATAEDAYQNI